MVSKNKLYRESSICASTGYTGYTGWGATIACS